MIKDNLLDVEALAATLTQYDVHYLRTSSKVEPLSLDPANLIAAIVQHPSPRLREALIPLFLRHPEIATHVPDLVENLPSVASQRLSHLYTAAVYLQRLWQGKLEMYLGHNPLLPDYFGQIEWGLPPPTEHYGEAGLRILAEQLRSNTGFNWLSAYQAIMSLYLKQLRLKVYG